MFQSKQPEKTLRIIKTARDEASINEAARQGFYPLVKKVEKSDKIMSKFAVMQNIKTGEIRVLGDYRAMLDGIGPDYETVIDFTFYYPHDTPSPFAAYLVPRDIEVGENVYLEDLIQDFVGTTWNQGDAYRLASCEAIWNGKDFDIQNDQELRCEMVG